MPGCLESEEEIEQEQIFDIKEQNFLAIGDNQVSTQHHYLDGGYEEDSWNDGVPWAYVQANTLERSEQGWPVIGADWDSMSYWIYEAL